MALSCSCQTPRVINPGVMRTTAWFLPPPRFATISLVPDSEGHKSRVVMRTTAWFLPPAMPLSRSCQTQRVINPGVMRTKAWFLPPALPLSRSCQTPKVINPSVMRTTAVELRNSIINHSLMALSCQSWSHKQLLCICLGVNAELPNLWKHKLVLSTSKISIFLQNSYFFKPGPLFNIILF